MYIYTPTNVNVILTCLFSAYYYISIFRQRFCCVELFKKVYLILPAYQKFTAMSQKNILNVPVLMLCLIILTGCSKTESPQNDIREGMLAAVNKLRHEGCTCGDIYMPPVGELKWNASLATAADQHVKDMVSNNYFSHIAPDGSFPILRAQKAGYTGLYVGENIARGYTTIATVVNGWKNSEEHCKAMMDTLYLDMGAARLDDYWVLDFGRNQ
jgi:uncharacterized protein YkwD